MECLGAGCPWLPFLIQQLHSTISYCSDVDTAFIKLSNSRCPHSERPFSFPGHFHVCGLLLSLMGREAFCFSEKRLTHQVHQLAGVSQGNCQPVCHVSLCADESQPRGMSVMGKGAVCCWQPGAHLGWCCCEKWALPTREPQAQILILPPASWETAEPPCPHLLSGDFFKVFPWYLSTFTGTGGAR